MDKENKSQIVKELEDFRKILSYYAKNRYEDYGPDLSEERKQLNRMLPKIKKYIVQAKIPTQISGRAPIAMGGAPFTMDIFDDIFLNERTPLAVDLNNTLDAVDKCMGMLEVGIDIAEPLPRLSRLDQCGPLGNKTCNQRDFIEKEHSDKNVFLDIPYDQYKEREAIIQEVISAAGLVAIIAKETLTSNAVICKVCKFIQKCKYGVADISFDRPSVTYELGLMHGFGFKVCILLQENSPKFSDIEGLEHTSYVSDLELRIKLARWLEHNVPETNILKIKEYSSDVEKRLSEGKGKPYPLPIIKKNTNEDLKDQILVSKQFSDKRLEEIKAEIKNKKYFILSATPIPLKDEIIDTNSEDVKGLFAKPGYSRGHGWNMSYASFKENITPTFEGIEKQSGNWKLKLYRNGYFEFRAEVDISFSWSQDEDEFKVSPRFNPHAITEFPASFIKLIKEFVGKFNLSESYIFKMVYCNCSKYKLRPYTTTSFGYMSPNSEREASLDNWVHERIVEKLDYSSDVEAFGMIQRLYNTFTFEDEHIPFFDKDKNFNVPGK